MTNQGQQPSFYPIGNPRSVFFWRGLEGVWRGSGGGLEGVWRGFGGGLSHLADDDFEAVHGGLQLADALVEVLRVQQVVPQ
eukprot:120435-Prorocentrum_minimum.AAC.1